MKHLLSIEAMEPKSIETILENAGVMKAQRGDSQHQRGQANARLRISQS